MTVIKKNSLYGNRPKGNCLSYFSCKHQADTRIVSLVLSFILLSFFTAVTAQNNKDKSDAKKIRKANVGGYMITQREKVDESYNAGYSMYAAAWPLLKEYSGRSFQSGLFGTWMHPQYDGPLPVEKLYTDIDPALIVSPPAGMEVGYVPIATKQGLE